MFVYTLFSNYNWSFMKDEGNKHFSGGRFAEALKWYRSAIIICPPGPHKAVIHRFYDFSFFRKLDCHCNRCFGCYSNSAECFLRLRNWEDVVREATLSLANAFSDNPVYIKTLFRRAKAFFFLNKPFEALGKSPVFFTNIN